MAFVFDKDDEEIDDKLFPVLDAYFSGMRESFISGDMIKMNPQVPKKLLDDIAKTIVEGEFKKEQTLMLTAVAMLVSDERNLFHGIEDTDLFIEAEQLLFNLKFLSQEDIYDYTNTHKKMLSVHGRTIEKKFMDLLIEKNDRKLISPPALSFLTAFIVDVIYECIIANVTYDEYLKHRGIEAI